jgi:hypothetical protein
VTALPGWMDLPDGLSAAEYEALPEDICRRLANALETACGPALAVSTGIDLRLRDIPLHNRRPHVVIYDAALPDDAVLRPQHCTLVVEIMSPGSVTADQTDKRLDPTTGTYASAGVHTGKMTVTEPVTITIDLTTLL